jgi:hypothetical protein
MFALLLGNFTNVTKETFLADLNRKNLVFLLHEGEREGLVGFSTQQIISLRDGSRLVFSGDTIITPSAWGTLDLPRAWGLWMLELKETLPDQLLYWLLISKGHRTFRFLTTYFKDFAPSRARSYLPREEEIVVEAAAMLFDREIVKSCQGYYILPHRDTSQRMAPHLQASQDRRTVHPEIEFFEHANPDFEQGSELICLLNYSVANMRPFCRRMLQV